MNPSQMLQMFSQSQKSLPAVLSRQTQTHQRTQRRLVCQNAAQTKDCCAPADDQTATSVGSLQQT